MQDTLRTVHVAGESAGAIVDSLVRELAIAEPVLVLFFVSSKLDFGAIATGIAERFPSSLTVGCTTAGELGSQGLTLGHVSALAIGAPAKAHAALLEELGEHKFEQATAAVAQLTERYGEGPELLHRRPEDFVFLTLTDGLSGAEELVLAALSTSAPEVAIVGGSAGDDFTFTGTHVAVNGRVARAGAVLVLLEPRRPFSIFHLHHYSIVGAPAVVTGADPSRRLVTRIDGFPAIPQLAKISGLDEAALRADAPATIASTGFCFGFELGDEVFIRGIMGIQDEALIMGGALEEGTLIYPMSGGDLVASTREGLDAAIAKLDAPEGLLLFNCGGRAMAAHSSGQAEALGAAMAPIPAAGFTTYGEQFGAAQVNYTLTGLVLGQP